MKKTDFRVLSNTLQTIHDAIFYWEVPLMDKKMEHKLAELMKTPDSAVFAKVLK